MAKYTEVMTRFVPVRTQVVGMPNPYAIMVMFSPALHPSLTGLQLASSPLNVFVYGAAKPNHDMILHALSHLSLLGGLGALFPEVPEKRHGLVNTFLSNRLCDRMLLPNYVDVSVLSVF